MKARVRGKAKERYVLRSSPNSAPSCTSMNCSVVGDAGPWSVSKPFLGGGGASVATESPRDAGTDGMVKGASPGVREAGLRAEPLP
ncbi:hypothetical protein GCM10010299_20130 [Streptomyces tanashiensis]|nr:hypothetical protein GCM10010299_20130 [Streptomyces tanashiensis]